MQKYYQAQSQLQLNWTEISFNLDNKCPQFPKGQENWPKSVLVFLTPPPLSLTPHFHYPKLPGEIIVKRKVEFIVQPTHCPTSTNSIVGANKNLEGDDVTVRQNHRNMTLQEENLIRRQNHKKTNL